MSLCLQPRVGMFEHQIFFQVSSRTFALSIESINLQDVRLLSLCCNLCFYPSKKVNFLLTPKKVRVWERNHFFPIKPVIRQTVLNASVHETTGEQPFYLMFSRYTPRSVSAPLPQDDEDADVSITHEVVKETKRERAKRWRDKGNQDRSNQRVELNSLVWVKKEQGGSSVQRNFGVKWLGSYKVKEIIRDGSAHVLENVFNGT